MPGGYSRYRGQGISYRLSKEKNMDHIFSRLLIVIILVSISCKERRYADALQPEEALKSFHVREGFKIQLFAAEPHVKDPVEMVFDEDGNAFVVEMPDYPFKPEDGKGAGRIKVLQDTDGDGRVDHTVIFADSLTEATSMLPWKGGLIVTMAPYIVYLKDTNADLVADTREILFSGFFANNSEAQITSLRFGVDNWIYAANNGQAGEVTFNRNPGAPALPMSGADFRFRLDRSEFELETGAGQFGQTMDDWGHRFITQNTLHIRHVVIPWRYLYRHPHLPSKNSVVNVSDHDLEMYQQTPPPYWRAERTRRRQKQYAEEKLDRVEYAEDHFTGCSGGTVYDGDAFPPEYYGNIFTGDVAGNLVHRDVLVAPHGQATFLAKRDETEKTREFLTSSDPWFRPASFSVGPDGLLYVVDMYRQHIETPLSIPEDLKADMDFLNGSELGRIYRIVPENFDDKKAPIAKLSDAGTDAYIGLLSHPSRWWRLQGQRLLLEKHDVSAVPKVKTLFAENQDARIRLHALYVLEGLNSLDASVVRKAMGDAHPGVREHGLMLSERYPELFPELLKAIDDTSGRVAFQAALSVGQFPGKKALDALAKVIAIHGEDPWFRTAVLSSKTGSSVAILQQLIHQHSFGREHAPWKKTFIEELSFVIGSANDIREVNVFLDIVLTSLNNQADWQLAGLEGLKKGLQKSSTADDATRESLEKIPTTNAGQISDAIRQIRSLYTKTSSL
jgi:putative membrane-bound dehydrogenase-like protein